MNSIKSVPARVLSRRAGHSLEAEREQFDKNQARAGGRGCGGGRRRIGDPGDPVPVPAAPAVRGAVRALRDRPRSVGAPWGSGAARGARPGVCGGKLEATGLWGPAVRLSVLPGGHRAAARGCSPLSPLTSPTLPRPPGWFGPGELPPEGQVLVSGVVLGHAGWEAAMVGVGVGVGERHGKTGESCSCRTHLLQLPHCAALRNYHSVSAASCTQGQPAPAGQEHVPPPPSIPFGFSFPWPKPQERSHIVRARRGPTRMRLRSHVFTRCKASYKNFILSRTFPTSLQGYRSDFSL